MTGRPRIVCPHGVVGISRCRPCQRERERRWREQNPAIGLRAKREGKTPREVLLGVAKEDTARRKAECQAFIAWLKEGLSCMDCGEKLHPLLMEFDHVPERGKKYATIATLAGKGQRRRLLEELPKTDLVCRVCHHGRSRSRYLLPKS